MVTASYYTDQMRELADEARDAGITVLNEVRKPLKKFNQKKLHFVSIN